jgi:hypothetical protein
VKEATHAGITPALGHLLQVVIEISEDDVAVAIDQGSFKALKGDSRSHGTRGSGEPEP